jgi:hypothetical protein
MKAQKSGNTVFLSYSHLDRPEVDRIHHELKRAKLNIYSDYSEMPAGVNWSENLNYHLQASDFILIFISATLLERDGMKFDYSSDFIQTLRSRNITIIPVRLDDTPIPSYLMEFEVFDLSKHDENILDRLIGRISNMADIALNDLTGEQFEHLIFDLLKELHFQNLQRSPRIRGSEFDFIGEFYSSDPFGQKTRETWIVETRFYKDAKLVLITNSQFTSVVQQFINDANHSDFIGIKTIDGFQLKNILASHPALITKYFKR